MEASQENKGNENAKGMCSPPVITSSQPAKDSAETSEERNGNDKAKENCIPRVNDAPPSTSATEKAAPRKRGKRGKGSGGVKAEQKHRNNHDIEIFMNNITHFFAENKDFLYILDHHTITVTAKAGKEFTCSTCSVQISSLKKVSEHIRSDKHIFSLEMKWLNKPVAEMKVVPQLDLFLVRLVSSHMLRTESLSLRAIITKEINDIFRDVPDCKVVMCGSSYHAAGLENCDLNLRLIVDEKDRNPTVFNSLILRMSNSNPGNITNVRKHMYSKNYFCTFVYKNTRCEIKFFEKKHLLNAIFVEACTTFDLRVKLLCILFRYWAKVCRILNKSGESWHSLALDLMVIYFLQNIDKPILPTFAKIPQCEREVDLKAELFLYFNDWKTKNEDSLAMLWCNLLKFYSADFDKFHYIITVTTNAGITQKSRQWGGKKFSVEDPFAPQANILNAPALEMYVYYCFKKSNLYFRTPQTVHGPVFDFIRQDVRPNTLNVDGYLDYYNEQMTMTRILVRSLSSTLGVFQPLLDDEDVSLLRHLQKNWTDSYVNVHNLNVKPYQPNSSCVILRKPDHKVALFPEEAELLLSKFKPEHSVFDFKEEYFNGGAKLPVNCQYCGKDLHADECPYSIPPVYSPLSVISPASVGELNASCFYTLKKYLLDNVDEMYRNQVIREIQHHIQQTFPNATLTPFGSSRNGFGLKNSDLDLCLTFTDDTYYKNNFKTEEFLRSLYRVLRRFRYLSHVTCISKATVPIIKFCHLPSGLEGDISIYNTLALINTSLLSLYCQLDWRVQTLGVMLKNFADSKNILGAPKGYLSSYAYTLMAIHFLQVCRPPIVPVLQELTADSRSPFPKVMHGEHNVYFMDNADAVKKAWPYFGQNKKSFAELWVEFLHFYCIIFDMDNHVVSIRTMKYVTKQEKQWYVRSLAVEDPFRMDTNLGRGLSMKRHNEIVQCFREELRRHL